MKVITATTALSALGPDYRFHTRFLSSGRPNVSGGIGTLYVVGDGDPLLVSERLWRIAENLKSLGVNHIDGDIILDDYFFDSTHYPRRGGNSTRAYAAKTSALSVNFNAFSIHVTPGAKSGAKGIVNIEPPVDYFHVVNKTRTGGKKASIGLSVTYSKGRQIITVSGKIPSRTKPLVYYKSVEDPLSYAGSVIKFVLRQNGIVVSGTPKRGKAPASAVVLLDDKSKPLSVILRSMNKFSNNFIAEQLTKHLGAVRYSKPGSTAKGIKVMENYLESIGLRRDSLIIENGSGLSSKTELSSMQMVHVLVAAFQNFSIQPDFIASLPIAGIDGTTRRFKTAPSVRGLARAKTGTLNGVSSLAGYVPMSNGRIAAFAIFANGLKTGADGARRKQMEVVKAIAEASQ
jgi:serine-type D-Ala-D-Ala carboxypeptidase/endopeptidase (penicillin-binding protein 4)